jgi:hypothetical protein
MVCGDPDLPWLTRIACHCYNSPRRNCCDNYPALTLKQGSNLSASRYKQHIPNCCYYLNRLLQLWIDDTLPVLATRSPNPTRRAIR